MIWNQFDMSKGDNNELYGSLNIHIENNNSSEILYTQKIFNLSGEVSVVPKVTIPILTKYGKDIIEMMKDKYPEEIIADDFSSFVNYIEIISAD